MMELCLLCERIKKIRNEQGKDYVDDLCSECRSKVVEKRKIETEKLLSRLLLI